MRKVVILCIVLFWSIDSVQDMMITVNKSFPFHLRDKIKTAIGIIAGESSFYQTVLFLQSFVKPGTTRGIEQADHCRDDTALLDEIDLPSENGGWVIIETDDKTALNFHTEVLYLFYRRHQVAVFILRFVALYQAIFIGSFNTDKDPVETGFYHHAHQFFIISQVDRCLSKKRRRLPLTLTPLDDCRQYFCPSISSYCR